ncbi:protein phosphatase 2C domain-containing protein [Streptomyces sp. NPDC046197]|uniref:protein phosphatase 2C domain-containing protein n=1 Tax=Streptomyces sp. NPDC046197 TaxID=3154337 RepID=UPI0033E0391C
MDKRSLFRRGKGRGTDQPEETRPADPAASPPHPEPHPQGDPGPSSHAPGTPPPPDARPDQPRYDQPRQGEPRYGEAGYGEPRHGEPRYGESRHGEPRYGESRHGEPRYGEPRQGDPRHGEPRYGGPRRGEARPNPAPSGPPGSTGGAPPRPANPPAAPGGPGASPPPPPAAPYVVPDYAVPGYEVPQYTVPEYAGPDPASRPDAGLPVVRDPRGAPPVQPGAPTHRTPGPRHAAPPAEPGAQQQRYGPPAPTAPQETDRWQRIVLGTPAARLEPKPPPADPYRPDTIYDGWSTPHLTVRMASVRGDQHRFGGLPRQDDVVVTWHEPTGTVVFAVADGVSAAPQSHVGAALACRTAVNDLLVQLDQDRQGPDWSRVLQAAAYQLLMRVARGREPGEHDRAEAARTLATTLVAGTVAPAEDGRTHVTLVRAGDSSAWCLHRGQYSPLLGDGDGGSEEISSTAVVALPRLSSGSRPISYTLPADAVLLVGTDGFGVPLGDGTGVVGELFASGLTTPPPEPWTLAHLLDFSRETFDDDRTLLAVWPRHRLRGPR